MVNGPSATEPAVDEQLRILAEEIKALVKARKDCSHALAECRKNNADVTPVQQRMREIKSALKAKKQAKHDLLAKMQSGSDQARSVDPLPRRLRASISDHPTAADSLRISPYTADLAAAVDDFVRHHLKASPWHFCCVREVIQRVFGKQDVSLVARDADGRILGVLPLVRLKSRLFGDFLVSIPYFNYGGPLAVDGATETRLLEAAVKRCEVLGVEHMEIRETHARERWPQRTEKVNMILPLPRDYAELDAGLGAKVRAQTKRAERENVRVHTGGVELLDAFYRVFAINMRDLGTPVYSRTFFRALLECDAFYTRLIVVELDGRPVAAAFLAGHGDMLEIPWASTLKQANAVSMNMFLYRQVLSHAIDQGYEFFDFGRSSRDSSTYRFKQQWGAQPVQNYWHYWLAGGGELPQLNPNNPKFRLLIATWRRLPVLLTRVIGPHVVKNLP